MRPWIPSLALPTLVKTICRVNSYLTLRPFVSYSIHYFQNHDTLCLSTSSHNTVRWAWTLTSFIDQKTEVQKQLGLKDLHMPIQVLGRRTMRTSLKMAVWLFAGNYKLEQWQRASWSSFFPMLVRPQMAYQSVFLSINHSLSFSNDSLF